MRNFKSFLEEKAPKMGDDYVAVQRKKDAEHAKAMGRSVKTGRKLPTKKLTPAELDRRRMSGVSEDIDEKTLTPAEKRKREEIAKAIERDNPNMPMAKKMAIATATAKKVAEASDTQMGTITVKTDAERKARAQAYRDKKAKEAMKKEEAEPVAEKSKGLWANIHAKRKRGEKPNPPGHPDRPTKADFKSAQKNEQIDELSKNTLGSYIGKAVDDMKKKKDQVSKGTLSMKDLRKGQNRNTMITKAQDKAHNK